MDGDAREMLGRLQEGQERIENMLHRALHGSEPDTAGIYKRLDRVESDVATAKSAGKWGLGIIGTGLGAVCVKLFGGGS